MQTITRQEKLRFWKKWTFQHTWIIPVAYILNLIVLLIFAAIFGIRENEFGTKFQQLVMQIAGSIVLGFFIGYMQRSILGRIIRVQPAWILSVIIGFVLAEAVAGFICWRLELNRMELRFLELNALPESLIFAFAGLLIGLLNWFILREQFAKSLYWIVASCIGWGICILVMDYTQIFTAVRESSYSILTDILVFLIGATLYGALTGATLMWVMRRKAYGETGQA